MQLLSWKQSFYLKKLIPIEDIERLLVKAIALFFYIFITNNKYYNERQVLNAKIIMQNLSSLRILIITN